MFSVVEFLLIIGVFLSISAMIISIYRSYLAIKNIKYDNCYSAYNDVNSNRALIELLEYKKTHNIKKLDQVALGDILRSKEQALLYDFIKESNRLPVSFSDTALRELLLYAKKINPDYIVGINRGGTMVGAIAALKLNIPSSNFLRCYVDDKVVECHVEKIKGAVMIIDDISRTGKTLARVKNYFLEHNKNINKIIISTLFMYVEKDRPIYQEIDFFAYKINNKNVMLPWNNSKITKENQFKEIENTPTKELAAQLEKKIRPDHDNFFWDSSIIH